MQYDPDKVKLKSIELGFNGKTPPEFYEKWRTTNKVRLKLKLELFCICILMAMFIYICFINLFFIVLSLIWIIVLYKNLYIWYDIYRIKKERFEMYMEGNENESKQKIYRK